jgi:hypothetical protein
MCATVYLLPKTGGIEYARRPGRDLNVSFFDLLQVLC